MSRMNLRNRTVEPLPVVNAAQLKESPPEQHWLIESLWPLAGVGLVGGHPKSCKSWLGLELAVSIASGTPCLGRFAVRQAGNVLIYMAEDALTIVRERLAALAGHRGIPLTEVDVRVITIPSLRIDTEYDMRRLDVTLANHKPRMLILDPFVRLHRSDENNSQEVAAILAELRTLQRKHDVAIALVHHARKNNSSGQFGQSIRGSGDFFAWADVLHYLNRESKGLRMTIEHRTAPAPEPMFLELTGEPPHLVITDYSSDKSSLKQRILDIMKNAGEPLRRTEMRSILAVNNQRLGEALAALEKLGRIRRTERGWHC